MILLAYALCKSCCPFTFGGFSGGQGGTFVSVLSLSCFHKKNLCCTRRVKKLLLSFRAEAQLIKSKGRTKILICCSWMTLLVGAGLAGGH